MKCEVAFCIYNQGYVCMLDETRMNELGMCAECVTILLDADFLEREKARQRKEIAKRSEKWNL